MNKFFKSLSLLLLLLFAPIVSAEYFNPNVISPSLLSGTIKGVVSNYYGLTYYSNAYKYDQYIALRSIDTYNAGIYEKTNSFAWRLLVPFLSTNILYGIENSSSGINTTNYAVGIITLTNYVIDYVQMATNKIQLRISSVSNSIMPATNKLHEVFTNYTKSYVAISTQYLHVALTNWGINYIQTSTNNLHKATTNLFWSQIVPITNGLHTTITNESRVQITTSTSLLRATLKYEKTNLIYSADTGILDLPSFADIGQGRLVVGDGRFYFYSSALYSYSGFFTLKTITTTTLSNAYFMTPAFVVADWNSGSPIYRLSYDSTEIDNGKILSIIGVYRNYDNRLDYSKVYVPSKSVGPQIVNRLISGDGFIKSYGLELSSTSNSGITVASGLVYLGVNPIQLGEFDSTKISNNIYTSFHKSGYWTNIINHAFNNAWYDNGTNRILAPTNKYIVNWYYRQCEELTKDVDEILHTRYYNTLDEANISQLPSELPVLIGLNGYFIGRIITTTSNTNIVQLDMNFQPVVQPGQSGLKHNNILNLDFGSSGHTGFASSGDINIVQNMITSVSNDLHSHISRVSNQSYISSTNWATSRILFVSNSLRSNMSKISNQMYQSITNWTTIRILSVSNSLYSNIVRVSNQTLQSCTNWSASRILSVSNHLNSQISRVSNQSFQSGTNWATVKIISVSNNLYSNLTYNYVLSNSRLISSSNQRWGYATTNVAKTLISISNRKSTNILHSIVTNEASTKDKIFPVDINRFGFMVNNPNTSIHYDGTNTFTLSNIGASPWSYYRSGLKYTITGNKSVTMPSGTNGFNYIYINSTDGTLTASTAHWTLNDSLVPVAVVRVSNNLNPRFLMMDERHTCAIDRRSHRIEHFTEGTKVVTAGSLSGLTAGSTANSNKCWTISTTTIADEDLFITLNGTPRTLGTTNAYTVLYRTSPTVWKWTNSIMPFYYRNDTDRIRYDNNGTMTTIGNTSYVNYYLIACNVKGIQRYMVIPGRGSFANTTLAYAESFSSFDLTGLPLNELVVLYQITYQESGTPSSANRGECQYVSAQRVNANAVSSSIISTSPHNSLSGLQGGTNNEYYHLSYGSYNYLTNVYKGLSTNTLHQATLVERTNLPGPDLRINQTIGGPSRSRIIARGRHGSGQVIVRMQTNGNAFLFTECDTSEMSNAYMSGIFIGPTYTAGTWSNSVSIRARTVMGSSNFGSNVLTVNGGALLNKLVVKSNIMFDSSSISSNGLHFANKLVMLTIGPTNSTNVWRIRRIENDLWFETRYYTNRVYRGLYGASPKTNKWRQRFGLSSEQSRFYVGDSSFYFDNGQMGVAGPFMGMDPNDYWGYDRLLNKYYYNIGGTNSFTIGQPTVSAPRNLSVGQNLTVTSNITIGDVNIRSFTNTLHKAVGYANTNLQNNVFMNDKKLAFRGELASVANETNPPLANDTNHYIAYTADQDGVRIKGYNGGMLSSGTIGNSLYWDNSKTVKIPGPAIFSNNLTVMNSIKGNTGNATINLNASDSAWQFSNNGTNYFPLANHILISECRASRLKLGGNGGFGGSWGYYNGYSSPWTNATTKIVWTGMPLTAGYNTRYGTLYYNGNYLSPDGMVKAKIKFVNVMTNISLGLCLKHIDNTVNATWNIRPVPRTSTETSNITFTILSNTRILSNFSSPRTKATFPIKTNVFYNFTAYYSGITNAIYINGTNVLTLTNSDIMYYSGKFQIQIFANRTNFITGKNIHISNIQIYSPIKYLTPKAIIK